jgi:hypothetical protein
MRFFSRFVPQPLVSVATALNALFCFAMVWLFAPSLASAVNAGMLLLAGCLGLATVFSVFFPIHVSRSTQVSLSTVPIYLIAVLLVPPIAVITGAAGLLASEVAMRKRRKTYPSDMVTSAARLVPGILLAGLAEFGLPATIPDLVRPSLAAAVLWSIDIFTAPLLIAPAIAERPFVVLVDVFRHSSVVEIAQYPIGVAAVLAAMQNPWWLVAFVLPVLAVHQHFKRLKELHDQTRQLLERIADTVDDHDAYTGGHSRRVAIFTEHIVKMLQVERKETDLIVLAARIHDIGKIDIPASVLQKPGRLNPEERALIETHPDKGADMLLRYPGFGRGVDMIRFHHEAWDGSGYPRRVKGTGLPVGARVIAVADSFDAMTSDRPYRKGMPVHRAAMELQRGRGTQWDAACVDAFLAALPEIDVAGVNGIPPLRLVASPSSDLPILAAAH